MQLSSPGDHISVVFSIKSPLKLIWLKVSSAFNLGQGQQWNFPSLSCNGCDVCEVKVEDSVTSKETKKKESLTVFK